MPRSDDPLKFFKGFRPCVRVGRAIHFDGGGGADDVAEFSEGGDLPFAHGLHQQIAHGRGFGRARQHGPRGCRRDELAQQGVVDAPAYDVNVAHGFAEGVFELIENAAAFEREAFEGRADDRPFAIGWRLVRANAEGADAAGHIPGRAKVRVIRVDEGREPIRVHRQCHQLFPRIGVARQCPDAAALLHDPQTRNIFEKTDGVGNPALVGEVVREGFFIDGGFRQFRAHQRPCAAANIDRIGRRQGHGRNCGSRVVTRRRDHVDGRYAHVVGDAFANGAEHRAGRDDFGQHAGGNVEGAEHLGCPCSLARVVALRSGGVGIFADLLAREPEVEQVGHGEKGARHVELGGARETLCQKLIERVEFHKLNAGAVEYRFARDALKGFAEHALRARVPITIGVAEQVVVRVEQAVIDPPCVATHARKRFARPQGQAQAGSHFVKQAQGIPVVAVADGYAPIGKAVNFFDVETRPIKPPQNSPPTGRAQVIGEVIGRRCHGLLPLLSICPYRASHQRWRRMLTFSVCLSILLQWQIGIDLRERQIPSISKQSLNPFLQCFDERERAFPIDWIGI